MIAIQVMVLTQAAIVQAEPPSCGDLFSSVQVKFEKFDHAATVTLETGDPRFVTHGTIEHRPGHNWLHFTLLTRQKNGARGPLSGRESLDRILHEFKERGYDYDMLQATWTTKLREYDGPSDNLMAFLKLYREAYLKLRPSLDLPKSINDNLPYDIQRDIIAAASEAARGTWTGKQMPGLGLHYIHSISISGNLRHAGADDEPGSIDVYVRWSKNKPAHPTRLEAYQTYGDSSIPRFHELLRNLFEKGK
jgi:hypothetical protein